MQDDKIDLTREQQYVSEFVNDTFMRIVNDSPVVTVHAMEI